MVYENEIGEDYVKVINFFGAANKKHYNLPLTCIKVLKGKKHLKIGMVGHTTL